MPHNPNDTHTSLHSHTHDQHDVPDKLSPDEKMIKRLEHWVKHNDEHADAYLEWAQKAGDMEMTDLSRLLAEAAELTMAIRQKIEKAIALMNDRSKK